MKFLLKNISPKYFVALSIIILFGGIGFILGLNYIINIKYSPSSQSFFNSNPLTTKPKSFVFNVDSPENNIISFKKTILISGKSGSRQNVLIASESKQEVLQSDQEGSFAKSWELEKGLNVLKIVSFNDVGKSKEEVRTLFYEEEDI